MGINFDKNKKYTLTVAVMLSLQRALLCEVSSHLRMVAFNLNEEENVIFVYFYFDGEITDEDLDSASCITGEVSGDFDSETQVLEKCIQLDFPERLPTHMYTVYRRRE